MALVINVKPGQSVSFYTGGPRRDPRNQLARVTVVDKRHGRVKLVIDLPETTLVDVDAPAGVKLAAEA